MSVGKLCEIAGGEDDVDGGSTTLGPLRVYKNENKHEDKRQTEKEGGAHILFNFTRYLRPFNVLAYNYTRNEHSPGWYKLDRLYWKNERK